MYIQKILNINKYSQKKNKEFSVLSCGLWWTVIWEPLIYKQLNTNTNRVVPILAIGKCIM